jgi:hypothetical protein
MGTKGVERKLRQTSARLSALREELQVMEEQRFYLDDDEGHVEAMERAEAKARAEIAQLELEQDALLDRLAPS